MDIAVVFGIALLLLVAVIVLGLRVASQNRELRFTRRLYMEECKKGEKITTLLARCGFADNGEASFDSVAKILADNSNMKYELGRISFVLEVPALASKATRIDKISAAIALLRKAANGGIVSNREVDYK